MLTRDEATTRVAKGAAHLDQVRPGWFTRIDVGTLTLHDPCGCIVGQLIPGTIDTSFYSSCKALAVSHEQAFKLGFNIDIYDCTQRRDFDTFEEYRVANFGPLQDAWIAEIADRVLAAAQAHREPASVVAVRASMEQPVVGPRA